LFFGRIKGDKDVPLLIDRVRALPRLRDGREVVLLVAGEPIHSANRELVLRARGDSSRVHLHLRFIPDDETQLFFRAADLVALPHRELVSSAVALLALGFDRPVLMPRRGVALELARTLGSSWVGLYDELTVHELELALLRASQLPPVSDGRHLSHLAPGRIARDTLRAYEKILSSEARRAATRGLPRLAAR
jgi:glycosyltransferase involved in cell wall biosynthesis